MDKGKLDAEEPPRRLDFLGKSPECVNDGVVVIDDNDISEITEFYEFMGLDTHRNLCVYSYRRNGE